MLKFLITTFTAHYLFVFLYNTNKNHVYIQYRFFVTLNGSLR